MSDHWSEFFRRVDEMRQTGDLDRLRLLELHDEADRHRETNPELRLALHTRCRDEARRLNEPWWVLFFEYWRLDTLTSSQHNFAQALPLAMELMVRFNSPEGRAHPFYVGVLTSVLHTYLQIDPLGRRDELERGFEYLNNHVAPGPNSDRFVLNYRHAEYLSSVERWSEAFEAAEQSLALADACAHIWHAAWALFLLCRCCDALGRGEEIGGYADYMVQLSGKSDGLKRTLADGWLWRAVAERTEGDDKGATNAFHIGMRHLKTLAARDEISADPIARYYELGGDWKSALGVRARELADVAANGMMHRACQIEIERCRLLSRAGELTAADVDKAREAAARMRCPDWYLDRLAHATA